LYPEVKPSKGITKKKTNSMEALIKRVPGVFTPRTKRLEREADLSPPSSAEVNKV
jgi:hypothetical protein